MFGYRHRGPGAKSLTWRVALAGAVLFAALPAAAQIEEGPIEPPTIGSDPFGLGVVTGPIITDPPVNQRIEPPKIDSLCENTRTCAVEMPQRLVVAPQCATDSNNTGNCPSRRYYSPH
ncbi:MAG TPA: hypothetical protein VMF32_09915 [Xanthobacteraceae bacterium]|nr:hypothetical protein [Xanthobacteraceae bacterium]